MPTLIKQVAALVGTALACVMDWGGAAVAGPPAFAPDGPYRIGAELNVFFPMRDGVRLATDVYGPVGLPADRLPTILIRTPYNKGSFTPESPASPEIRFFASHGYKVVVQDVRGAFRSGGDYKPSWKDDVDGYDTIEWLARQRWSNGRIGTFGCSYMGDVQIFAASLRPPSLKAMIPQASGSAIGSAAGAYRYFGVRVGGALDWAAAVGWFANNGYSNAPKLPDTLARDDYTRLAARWPAPTPFPLQARDAWWHLPMVDALASQEAPPTEFAETIARAPSDAYWRGFPYLTNDYAPDVPALFVNSWYDFGADMVLYEFNQGRTRSRSALARDHQYAVMGPQTHCASESAAAQNAMVGERPVGDTRFDYFGLYLAWFDHWLKDADNGVLRRPAVTYYAMGANQWRSATAWPPPGSHSEQWYLDADTAANSLFGDGRLERRPSAHAGADRFVYDPANPVPSRGGAMCCTASLDALPGSVDQRAVEARQDVLVYSSAPLAADLAASGPVSVTLYVDSTAPDTDFTAKLVDVAPDGTAFNVLESILRARYRGGQDRELRLTPSEAVELKIPLGETSNVFLRGHRLRLEVSSSNFPRFDRNLNMGTANATETRWQTATNRVFRSAQQPSHLTLTIAP